MTQGLRFLRQLLCRHFWRPALIGRPEKAARVCHRCEKIELLSDAEFYMYFGRIPRIGAV